jgi:hypothetical protein
MDRHLRNWKRIFKQRRGRTHADTLIGLVECELHQLQTSPPKIPNRTLQAQWDNLIAPGLALYRGLLAEGSQEQRAVLAETEVLFKASFFSLERMLLKLVNLVPDPFPLVRLGLRNMTQNHYLPGASEVIEDSNECFAVNTTRCFILDILTEHDAAELASLYCKTDDWLAAEVPKVHWLRTKTLANGESLCDFRWCRQNKEV